MTKVLLSLLLLNLTLLSIHAEEIDFKKIENSYFTECKSNFQYSTLGILRPDQGTIELNTTLNKPFTEFGNDWHFALKINSTKYFKNGGTSLFGIFIPPLPEKGLVAIIKDGKKRRYLSYKDFSYQSGDKINIALSWGERMKLYVNGKVVAESNYSVRVPDALIPYNFTIERLDPFKVSEIKISSIALPEKDISKDPTVDFTQSENTTFLSTNNLNTHHRFQTPWHKQSGYATIKAASRLEKLCFVEGDTPFFSLLSINYSPTPISYQVELTAKSRPHGKIITKETTITSNNTGLNELHLIKLPQLKKRGFYDLKVEIYQEKNRSYEFESALAIFPAPDKKLKAGILSNYYGQHYTYGKFDASVLKQLNIKSIRAWAGASIFRWFNIEPTKGTFRFEKTDEYVKMCQQAGVTEILGLLSNPPRWAAVESDKSLQAQHRLAPQPNRWKPKDLKEWGNYVYKMVDRYKDDIQHWEIYNEVNFHPPAKPASFSGSTQEYFDLLKVAYQQAKKANPNCKILISGFTIHGDKQMPYDLLKMGAADYFDIFNIHGYDGVKTTLPYLEALKKVKPEAPYWMTEQFWLHIENEERRVILTPQIFINFIEQGYQRFFNMGWEEFFSNKYSKSPEIDIYLTSILLNQIRTCDKFIGKVTFSGDESFQIKHSFQRTDGSFLTVLGSGDESFNIEFANAPLSVETAYGEALTSISNEKHIYANDKVIYVSSKNPLNIIKLTSTGRIELMRNGSFDEIEGDITMGGSQAGKPIGWKYNDKTWSFSFTEDSKDSKYALQIKASKEKRLYILQDTKIFSPGKYTLSCYLKKTGQAKTEATVSISNRSEEHRESQTFEIISNSKFERFEVSINIKEAPAQPLGLVIGIRPGQGGMIVDDIRFEKVPPP